MTVFNKHHGDAPKNAVYIGRGSRYGNPFVVGRDGTREEVITSFEEYVESHAALQVMIEVELKGKDLVCFCKPLPCHGDVIDRIANE
jgi:hypothetical protein